MLSQNLITARPSDAGCQNEAHGDPFSNHGSPFAGVTKILTPIGHLNVQHHF